MTNLKEARKSGDLEKFIQEHIDDPKGDKTLLEKVVDRAVKRSETEKNPDQVEIGAVVPD